nr:carbohydrate sulfotransferase 9-like [Cherax quadricarinatus]
MTGNNLTGNNLTGNNLTGNNLTGNNLTGNNLTGNTCTVALVWQYICAYVFIFISESMKVCGTLEPKWCLQSGGTRLINLKDKSTVEGRTARINQLRELCNSSSTNMKNDQWTINPGITPLSESSRNVVNILTERRKLLQTQCEEKLTPEEKAQPANSNEFLISDKYKLVWCNVFKAASTTWMFNFFIMAGKTEKEFRLSLKTSAVEETRKLYPRPSIEELNDSLTCLNYSSFIIVREPFERLLSSYRDKIESTAQYYFR